MVRAFQKKASSRIIASTEKDFRYYMTAWIQDKKIVITRTLYARGGSPQGGEREEKKIINCCLATEAPELETQSVEFDYK